MVAKIMANYQVTEIREHSQSTGENNITIVFSSEDQIAVKAITSDALNNDVTTRSLGQNGSGNARNEGQLETNELPGTQDVENPPKSKKSRGNYTKYSWEDRIEIGKLAAQSGNAVAQRKFQAAKFPNLSESTVRCFKALYENHVKDLILKKETEKRPKKSRGKYQTYTEQQRVAIGKCAVESGNAQALRLFKVDFPGLSESTVRGFKNAYRKKLVNLGNSPEASHSTTDISAIIDDTNNASNGIDADIKALRLKRGIPNRVSAALKATIARYLQAIQEKEGKPLSMKTVIGIAKGVVITENRFLLTEFGGNLNIDKSWAKSFVHHHHLEYTDDITTTNPEDITIEQANHYENQETQVLTEAIENVQRSLQGTYTDNCILEVGSSMLILNTDGGGNKTENLEILEDFTAITSIGQAQESCSVINKNVSEEIQALASNV